MRKIAGEIKAAISIPVIHIAKETAKVISDQQEDINYISNAIYSEMSKSLFLLPFGLHKI